MADGFRIPAFWYDGRSALRHEGMAEWDGADGLALLRHSGEPLAVDLRALRFAEERRGETVYHLAHDADFRLILPSGVPPGRISHLPAKQTYGGWIDRIGLGKAAAGFAVVSAAAVALFLTAPAWLGPVVPESWERRLGDAMVGDLGNRVCSTPESDRALARLLDQVDPAASQVRAGIVNMDMVNAAALPGSQVLLFDGLVQEAETPEELAGVLAHEVGHVRERHVMTALLRQFGLSVLTSGFNSNVGSGALAATNMSYSRAAEREADAWARAALARAQVSPVGAARFFERQVEAGKDVPDTMKWLSTHPDQLERAREFRAAAKPGQRYTPVLNPAEFRALKLACESDPDVEEFDLF